MSVKTISLWIVVAALLILGYALYRFRSTMNQLQAEPHAADEIEKAKSR